MVIGNDKNGMNKQIMKLINNQYNTTRHIQIILEK